MPSQDKRRLPYWRSGRFGRASYGYTANAGREVGWDFWNSASLTSPDGYITLTSVRATDRIRAVHDFDGVVRLALANEPTWYKWRRVYNMLPTGTATAPTGNTNVTVEVGHEYMLSMEGTGSVEITAGATGATLTGVTGERVTFPTGVITATGTTLTLNVTGTVTNWMLEDVTSQPNQNPSEYVSKGSLSAPYHGTGVDGVKYFPYENGNTFSGVTGVITLADGAAITGRGGIEAWPLSTNWLINSEALASWTAVGSITRTDNAALCGEVGLTLLSDTGGAELQGVTQSITYQNYTGARAVSFYFKKGGSPSASGGLTFRLRATVAATNRLLGVVTWSGATPTITMTTGTIDTQRADGGIEPLANGVFRAHLASTAATAAVAHTMEFYPASDETLDTTFQGDVYVGGAFCDDAGSSAQEGTCPYLPTAGAALTRARDVISTGSAGVRLPWINTTEFTVVWEGVFRTAQITSNDNYTWQLGTETNNRFLGPRRAPQDYITLNHRRGGNEQAFPVITPINGANPANADTVYRVVYGYKNQDYFAVANGNATPTTNNGGTMLTDPTKFDILYVGTGTSSSTFGETRELKIIPRRITNAEGVTESANYVD